MPGKTNYLYSAVWPASYTITVPNGLHKVVKADQQVVGTEFTRKKAESPIRETEQASHILPI